MFIYAACSTLLAFIVRLPVSMIPVRCVFYIPNLWRQIPEQDLDSRPKTVEPTQAKNNEEGRGGSPSCVSETDVTVVENDGLGGKDDFKQRVGRILSQKRRRRLSGFESQDFAIDPETLPTGSSTPQVSQN